MLYKDILQYWDKKFIKKHGKESLFLSPQDKLSLQKGIKKYGIYHFYNCINYYFRNYDDPISLGQLAKRTDLLENTFLDPKIAKPLWLMDNGEMLEMVKMVDLYFDVKEIEPLFAEDIARILNEEASLYVV